METGFIDAGAIHAKLAAAKPPDDAELAEILAEARKLKGVPFAMAERLLLVEDDAQRARLEETASFIKDEIYGRRLVLFAPLYVSNLCNNDCLYCAFRRTNRDIHRRTLTLEELSREVRELVKQGHKRVLLVSGEGLGMNALDYTLRAIETIYAVREGKGEIRRINVNIAALPVEGYRALKGARIGTYQLFQETYHPDTYRAMHRSGPKSDYLNHLTAMDRAMEAGIDDVGVGILFGLADYRFEIMALLTHIRHLEERFGAGVHTISVPRLEPAEGSEVAANPPHAVTDREFRKIIAVLRITVPYTGIILSTRENAQTRRDALALGVSQISAGSRTTPGGYCDGDDAGQFSLGDHRSLEEVIRDIASLGYIPSFCTGCYRLGRTGHDFMDLAKPGLIKHYCLPNALTSFKEYLVNYASAETRRAGDDLIAKMLAAIPQETLRGRTAASLERVAAGECDIYV